MFCSACGVNLPGQVKFCPSCGKGIGSGIGSIVVHSSHDETATPTANHEFRAKLLDFFLKELSSDILSRWLQDLKQNSKGNIDDKIARIRNHTQYLTTPMEEFPAQTLTHLRALNSVEILVDLCHELGLPDHGSKLSLLHRIYREIGYREGWLTPVNSGTLVFDARTVVPFVQWYLISSWADYERDYYDEFYDEMVEVFGPDYVHGQVAVAHGSTLKIDFHIGPLQDGGVGVEFKVPGNNTELQRARGQIEQYRSRYGSNLIVVLIPHLLNTPDVTLFRDALRTMDVKVVVRSDDRLPMVGQQMAA